MCDVSGVMSEQEALEARLRELEETIADELSGTFDRLTLVRAMRERAVTLVRLGRLDEADNAFGAIRETLGEEDPDPVVESELANAAYEAAELLWRRDDFARCLNAVEHLIQRWGVEPPPGDPGLVVSAYTLKADALRGAGRLEEALVVCDATLTRFLDSDEFAVQEQLDETAHTRGGVLLDLERFTEALATYRGLLDDHGWEEGLDRSPTIRSARLNEAYCLSRLDRNTEAIEQCDELLERYVANPDADHCDELIYLAGLREGLVDDRAADEVVDNVSRLIGRVDRDRGAPLARAVPALVNLKVWALLQALRIDEALALSDELIESFRDQSTPELLAATGETLLDQVTTMLYHARFDRQRRKLALWVAVRMSEVAGFDASRSGPRGRLAAVIALRTRLQNQAVKICMAVRERLQDGRTRTAQQLYADAGLTLAETWGQTLHPVRLARLIWNTEALGPDAEAAYRRRAESYQAAGMAPYAVIAMAVMSGIASDDEERMEEVESEMAERYGRKPSLLTRLSLWLSRPLRD